MRNKYFNDAIVGNSRLTVSFSKTGEILRLFYPSVDYMQFFEEYNVGVRVNDVIFNLNRDLNNTYEQSYLPSTNILETKIKNSYFNLLITQTDFVPYNKDVLIKRYKIKNLSKQEYDMGFIVSPMLFGDYNDDICGFVQNDILMQYGHAYAVCTFSKNKIAKSKLTGISENFLESFEADKNYIEMSRVSKITYELGNLAVKDEIEFVLYIFVNQNWKRSLLNEAREVVEGFRALDIDKEIDENKMYWHDYIKNHDLLNVNRRNISKKIKDIYNRTILLFSILTNHNTGGISAGLEVDEQKNKCGRYSYCWHRDAVFITKSFDILGMKEEISRFYKVFCPKTQSDSGLWEQRFFTDGNLAPSWGYQIDETASVVYGVYHHYKRNKDVEFLKETYKICDKAMKVLDRYVENLLVDGKEFEPSYDLWEEYRGQSMYSICSIYSAYHSMIKMLNILIPTKDFIPIKYEIQKTINQYENKKETLKAYIEKHFYSEEKNSFIRNLDDKKIDISILGGVYPFGVFSADDPRVANTIERMNMTIRTYTGGYVRYEDDKYMGGYNPWPISTLWMACYYIIMDNKKKALECFDYVVKTASDLNLLAEQIDNTTMKPAWVIGLTWSHAMFIITLEKLIQDGWI